MQCLRITYRFLKYRVLNLLYCLYTTQQTQSNCISSKHEISAFQSVARCLKRNSWVGEQEPTSAMLPVSYSAFICVESTAADPFLAWKRQTLILLVTKLLENHRNTCNTWQFVVNFTTIICFSVRTASIRHFFHPNFVCVLMSKAQEGYCQFGLRECSFAELRNQICSASSSLTSHPTASLPFFAGHMTKSVRDGKGGRAMQRKRDFEGNIQWGREEKNKVGEE